MDVATGAGPAVVTVDDPGNARFLLVLTHGAGGGVDSPDLAAVRQAGLAAGAAVARVLQPYRVRGARAPGSAERQDAAWLEVVAALRERFADVPLVQGGRSNGARVACRTAQAAGASGVVALAFPLHPPGHPERSRADELTAAGVGVLVVNGDRDPFGVPAGGGHVQVEVLAGQAHALNRRPADIQRLVASWLAALLPAGAPAPLRRGGVVC
jgi:predicted alpha/beta-hydrolase family hydrolase